MRNSNKKDINTNNKNAKITEYFEKKKSNEEDEYEDMGITSQEMIKQARERRKIKMGYKTQSQKRKEREDEVENPRKKRERKMTKHL